MAQAERDPVHRRGFLKALGLGAAAAAAPLAAGQALADTESDADKRKARYRETDHVKAFYRVNRY